MSTSDAYFLVPTGPFSAELWSTDGSPSGTTQITSPFGPFFDPGLLTQAGSYLFFADGATGELWVTDGQLGGTIPLTSGILADDLTSIGQTLFFVDDLTGTLWTSDGTQSGTQAVASTSSLSAENLTAVGGTLFFVDGNSDDLWTLTGGTAHDVGNFGTGTPSDLTAVGNDLYFVDSTGDLWKSDGTAGGTTDISPATGGFTSPINLVAAAGTLYFIDAATGNLWTSDGTVAGTIDLTRSAQVSDLTAVGNELFFVDQFGALWVSNGTPAGTQELADNFYADNLTAVGNELYFTDDDTGTLWKSDGTGAGTLQVTQVNSAPFDPTNLADVNGALYFQAFDPTNGTQLWTSDGTTPGTHLVDAIATGSEPENNPFKFLPLAATGNETFVLEAVDPIGFSDQLYATNGIPGTALTAVDRGQNFLFDSYSTASVGDELFFTPADTANLPNYELWETDGTAAGTVQIIPASGSFAAPTGLTALDGDVYFYDTTDNELWKSDGTAAGTVQIVPATSGSFGTISDLTVFGNSVVFTGGVNIWLIDGTSGAQTEITGSFGTPFDYKPVGGTLFFTDGSSLWTTDGTQADTTEVASGFSSVQNLTAVGSDVYFTDSGTEFLWESDGTTPATVQITGNFTDPSFLTADGGTLYFLATDGNNTPDTLWETDGTTTTEVYSNSIDGPPTVAGGALYFIAGDQLWMTTPGMATATEVTSNEGTFFPVDFSLESEGSSLYFEAWDPTDGYQLWTSDGTAAGTVRLTDNTEPIGAYPFDITAGPDPDVLSELHTVALAGGGFAVAFTEPGNTPNDTTENIYTEVFNAQGQQVGSTIEVNPPNTFDDSESFLTALPNGDFAVTWQTGANGDEIDTRVFDASGNPVSSAQVVAPGGDSAQAIETTVLSNGDYAILYQQTDSGDQNVYVSIFNSDGTAASGPIEVDIPQSDVSNFLVNSIGPLDIAEHTSILALQDGFAVTWESFRDNEVDGNPQFNAFVRVFGNSGNALTGEIQANASDGAGSDNPGDLVSLGGDNFALEWESDANDSYSTASVYTRVFQSSNDNYAGSTPTEVDTPPVSGVNTDPATHAVALTGGGYVVLWGQINQSTGNQDVYVQTYDANGNIAAGSQSGGIQVNTDTGFDIPDQVLALAGGGFAVMWDEATTGDVYVRTFNADGTPASNPMLADIPGGYQSGLEMIALQDGSFEVLWDDSVSTANGSMMDFYSRHVAADGTLLNTPQLIASTPSDLAATSDNSVNYEFRTALASSQLLLTGEVDGDSIDGGPFTNTLELQFTSSAPCYCPGTLIKTKRGQKKVEQLKIGDKVMTASGEARRIKWIGRRSYSGRFVMGRKDILPVCIKAGALEHNVPKRDLWISPNHAMFLDRMLIEAKDLINGVSVVQAESVESVEYYHVELDSHDVIIAEGALSESFVDDDDRFMFHNAHEYRTLYPDAAVGLPQYCAPRVEDGYEVEGVRKRIARRVGLCSGDDAPRIGTLRGYVDLVSTECIAGWAQNLEHPEAPVCLDVYADGRLIGQVLANRYREDLKRAGIGSGRHSFEFTMPSEFTFASDEIEVRRSLDSVVLELTIEAWRMLRHKASCGTARRSVA